MYVVKCKAMLHGYVCGAILLGVLSVCSAIPLGVLSVCSAIPLGVLSVCSAIPLSVLSVCSAVADIPLSCSKNKHQLLCCWSPVVLPGGGGGVSGV